MKNGVTLRPWKPEKKLNTCCTSTVVFNNTQVSFNDSKV